MKLLKPQVIEAFRTVVVSGPSIPSANFQPRLAAVAKAPDIGCYHSTVTRRIETGNVSKRNSRLHGPAARPRHSGHFSSAVERFIDFSRQPGDRLFIVDKREVAMVQVNEGSQPVENPLLIIGQ